MLRSGVLLALLGWAPLLSALAGGFPGASPSALLLIAWSATAISLPLVIGGAVGLTVRKLEPGWMARPEDR